MNTALDTTPTTETGRFAAGLDHTAARSGVAVLTAILVGVALVVPDRTVGPGMTGSTMTHYMGLLAVNQPWNLLVFMALPVVLAETLAITELAILFAPRPPSLVLSLNRWAGLLAGPVMLAITVHLVQHAVVPLTTGAGWRGTADVVAVLAYLTGLVPLAAITLVELGLVGRTPEGARKVHAFAVGGFLVVAHVAMIFGMLDPSVLGWAPTHQMPGGGVMPGMGM